MNQSNNISNNYTSSPAIITIGDLKDNYYDGIGLTEAQKRALKNFDKLRVMVLSSALNDEDFHKKYFEFKLKENTCDYKDFLD